MKGLKVWVLTRYGYDCEGGRVIEEVVGVFGKLEDGLKELSEIGRNTQIKKENEDCYSSWSRNGRFNDVEGELERFEID
jgi:hypothetical protein